MKKINSGARFSIFGFFLFLLPLATIVGFGIMIYDAMAEAGFSIGAIAGLLFVYIIFATFIISLFDLIRRKLMVDRPVEQILQATQQIAEGDFKIKLLPLHLYNKYDEYDKIMENINIMTKELSKSEILKTEFISNVSHEIKTPLAVIQNYAKALQNNKLDEETKKKYLQTLVSTSQKLSELVVNILKLNKLDNQKINPDKKRINIGEQLREIVLRYEDLIDKKKIELKCDISDVELVIEQSYMEIIFTNFISNAIKFTDEGGKVGILLYRLGDHVIFQVKDTGCGMSEEVGAHIFEKFYQGDTSHSSEGNGLGLALVKKVIDIMGGEISVASQEGKGSVFTVKLKRNIHE